MPVKGEIPTWARELGSRGAKIGFSTTGHDAARFPIDLDGSGAEAHELVERLAGASEEIHINRAVHLAAPHGGRAEVFQAQHRLAHGPAAAIQSGR